MQQTGILSRVSKDPCHLGVIVNNNQTSRVPVLRDYIFIRVDKKYVRVFFSELVYFEGLRNYIRIVTHSRQYLVLMTMGKMESFLPAAQFCRIHKSYIISLRQITAFDSDYAYLNDRCFPIGKTYKKLFQIKLTIAE